MAHSPPPALSMQYLTRRNLLWASHIREALSEDCRSRQKNIGSPTRGTTGFSCVGVSRLDWRALLSPLPSILSILLILSKTSLCVSALKSTAVFIDAAMKYYDKTQFGRDRTPGDPKRFHNVNSLVWRCGAAGVRALPVLTAHDISLPEQ